MKLIILSILLPLSLGCGRNWQRYDDSLCRTYKETTPQAAEAHLHLLENIIAEAQADGIKPPPGICLEYAYRLSQAGRTAEAAPWIARELQYYPESKSIATVTTRLLQGEKNVIPERADEEPSPQAKQDVPERTEAQPVTSSTTTPHNP